MLVSQAALLALVPLLVNAAPSSMAGKFRVPLHKRTSVQDEDGKVVAGELLKQLQRTSAKIQRGLTNFERNTGSAHPLAAKVSNKPRGSMFSRATGTDALTDDDDGQLWQGDISVGSPAQQFTVDFDTGSSDLFLPAVNCNTNCAGHTRYDTSASSTAHDLGTTFTAAFGDGSSVSGEQFTDTVTVAGLTATGQTLGSATTYSTGFAIDEFPPDGLLGLAFESISVFPANPVFTTLNNEGALTNNEFGVKLATSGSELTLGGIDNSAFTGDLTFVPLETESFWEVLLQTVTVNGAVTEQNADAIIDTGTTLIVTDVDSAEAFYSAPGLEGVEQDQETGLILVSCDTIPTVSFTMGGRAFDIPADLFNQGVFEGNECVGAVQLADLPEGTFVLGDTFLQTVYAVFDAANSQVGFATQA